MELNDEVRCIWNRLAFWWDEQIGPEGNVSQQQLIGPATERLLALRHGGQVLDIACGNGAFSRRLVQLGAQVVAFDFSNAFIERAKAQTTVYADRIEYHVADATDSAALQHFGKRRFDAAVCTNALMDMATLEPLATALAQLLVPSGRFVFSVSHPCFNSTGSRRIVEEEYRDGTLVPVYGVQITEYLHTPPRKGIGIVGEPEPHYYFDRPLSALLAPFFATGFALTGLEEPTFASDQGGSGLSWRNYTQIPPFLVGRMALVTAEA